MKSWLWMVLFLIAGLLPGFGAGIIIIHDDDFWQPHPPPRFVPPIPRPRPVPPPQPVWAPLEVDHVHASIKVADQVAVTKIEQEFYNPNSRQLEGTFLFPVPKGAQIDKFSMEINGKQVDAELMASGKAKGIYEDIVRKLKDPALLEYAGRDLFKVRIFPIEPNSKKRIKLTYSQVLKSDDGLVNLTFPLNTEKYSAKPLRNVSVKVDLETKQPLKSVYSPTHKVEVKRDGPRKATIGFESSDVKPDSDFQLFYTTEKSDLAVNLLAYKTGAEDGYFLLLASPGTEVKETKVIPKDVTFVLDTSGSMAGAKLEQAKKALLFCVENLNDKDRFQIIRFSTEAESLFDSLVDAETKNRQKARDFIKDLKPIGGTAIDDALKKALSSRTQEGNRPFVVIFLTDGRPTVGNTDEHTILRGVQSDNNANTRVFCFGIGTDVNTHLLDQIAEETKAFSQYVLPDEDLELKVSSFYTKIKEPVLANPQITFPGDVRVTKLYPSPVPDLFKGEQLILAGRYSGKGSGALQVEGLVDGQKKKFAYDVSFPDEANDHEFIPRLWATRRVGYLLDEIRLHGENKELKDEITELARHYDIVTPYTAYLILEDETTRNVPTAFRTVPENDGIFLRENLSRQYNRFRDDKDGSQAVGGARSSYSLKAADAPSAAVQLGREEAYRGLALNNPADPATGLGANSSGTFAGAAPAAPTQPQVYKKQAREMEQLGRYIKGKTFYYRDGRWMDSEVQKLENPKKVRIQFGSPEYFDLIQKEPKIPSWLSLGPNLQFTLKDVVYEVYE